MKILIVEDERRPREGLYRMLQDAYPWIDLMTPAQDAQEGLRYASAEKPDIIITDIEMPGTDGLEMIRLLTERSYSPYIIVISGYSNFTYAQKALSLGVHEYILKPYQIEEVKAKLDTAIRNRSLIDTGIDETSIQEAREALLIRYQHDVDPSEVLVYLSSYLSKFSGNSIRLEHQHDRQKQVLVITFTGRNGTDYPSIPSCKECMHRLALRFEQHIVGMLLSPSEALSEYNLPEHFLYAHVFYQFDPIIPQETLLPLIQEDLTPFVFNYEMMVNKPMFRLDEDSYRRGVHDWMLSLRNKRLSPLRCYQELISLLYKLHFTLQALHRQPADIFSVEAFVQDLCNVFSPQELEEHLADLFPEHLETDTMEAFAVQRSENPLVLRTLTLIYQHIHEPVSLETIADTLQVSSEHLSRVFKTEMGLGFTHFVHQLKIEHAKAYLREHSMNIQEIADTLGYSSIRYMGKVFKKVTGMTIKEFSQHSS